MLKLAASARTAIPVDQLSTEDGAVILPDGERLAYTDLARDAAGIEAPAVSPRDPATWRWLGKPMQRIDIVAKSTGTFAYGGDIKLPAMIHATAVTNPARGGGVVRMDATAAEAAPGVEAVLQISDGFAVLARTDWHAFNGARMVEVEWGQSGTLADTGAMWAAHAEAIDNPDHRDSQFRDDGSPSASPASEVEYRAPFLAHAPLEPSTATVLYTPEATQVWASTQAPIFLRDAVARITGQDANAITIHAIAAGGSFGRRLEDDNVRTAVEVAMARPGSPIRLTWSREQDMQCDYYRPMALARGRISHDGGRVTGLDLSIAAHSVTESQMGRVGLPVAGPDIAVTAAAWDAPYALPNFRVTGYRVPAGVGVSSWRSVGASHNGFFMESLLDEAIHAAGADPVEERLRLLSDPASTKVLETVAEMCSWTGPEGKRGVAFSYSFGVPCAQIVEIEQTDAGIRVAKLWIAADVGRVLDPVNLEAQLSGGALFGLGHAMLSEITFDGQRPEQENFDTFESLRLYQTPDVSVQALGLGGPIRGAGEPGVPPAAPALANAVFAATGQRLREMPFANAVRFV